MPADKACLHRSYLVHHRRGLRDFRRWPRSLKLSAWGLLELLVLGVFIAKSVLHCEQLFTYPTIRSAGPQKVVIRMEHSLFPPRTTAGQQLESRSRERTRNVRKSGGREATFRLPRACCWLHAACRVPLVCAARCLLLAACSLPLAACAKSSPCK